MNHCGGRLQRHCNVSKQNFDERSQKFALLTSSLLLQKSTCPKTEQVPSFFMLSLVCGAYLSGAQVGSAGVEMIMQFSFSSMAMS